MASCMKRFFPLAMRRAACRVCHATRFVWPPDATTSVGLPDLDSRPGGPARKAILHAIRMCHSCGYCGSVLSDGDEVTVRVVRSSDYQRLLKSRTFPRLAQKWMCWSTIQEASSQFSGAGWSSLRAAWVCDDRRLREPGLRARNRSIRQFEQARAANQTFGTTSASEAALLADLHRRCGQFESATVLAESEQPDDETIAVILQAQQIWSARHDMSCYTLANAARETSRSKEKGWDVADERRSQRWLASHGSA
jgi:hypothetical protein